MKILILGGARSGKSAHAEFLAAAGVSSPLMSPSVTYVATARSWPGDKDFQNRIAKHQARRPQHWVTVDDVDAMEVLQAPPPGVVLVDDLGCWIQHHLDRAHAWDLPAGSIQTEVDQLVEAIAHFPAAQTVILVSPEVGMSVIPEHRSGRLFRDEIGALNARLAEVCDQVDLVVAGLPLSLK